MHEVACNAIFTPTKVILGPTRDNEVGAIYINNFIIEYWHTHISAYINSFVFRMTL